MSQNNLPSGSRPPSSLSTRPSSSASYRTASRISLRPTSRISQRPSTRQSARVSQQCHDLVSQVTGLSSSEDEEEYAEALELVTKRIDSLTKQAVGLDMKEAETHLRRLATKARIQSRDRLSEALGILRSRIHGEAQKKNDLDTELKISKLPDHLQFLILLSMPPSEATLDYADRFVDLVHNPPPPAPELTWKKILEEEPLEGEHWRGAYGLPAGAVADEWADNESTDSSPLLTPDSDLADLDESLSSIQSDTLPSLHDSPGSPSPSPHPEEGIQQRIVESLRLREELETLQHRQYWRSAWRTDANPNRPFSPNEPSTLGPAAIVGSSKIDGVILHDLQNERYIHEHDAVREVLMALQGQENLLFNSWNDSGTNVPKVKVSSSAPKLLHLSPLAQHSILEGFAEAATAITQLKQFCQNIISTTPHPVSNLSISRPSQTMEAFAESVINYIYQIDAWCSQREEKMLRACEQRSGPTVVSLLSLSEALREAFSDTFFSLRDILFGLFPQTLLYSREAMVSLTRRSPSLTACRLVDALFEIAQARQSFRDCVSTSALMRIFVATAEPTWRMLGHWMRDGIFMQDGSTATDHVVLPPEFFIESNEVALTDPDFWSEGYQLRSSLTSDTNGDKLEDKVVVPSFLVSVADQVLSAGKSVGLLRILGKSHILATSSDNTVSVASWPTFEAFLRTYTVNTPFSSNGLLGNMSSYDVSLVLSEQLSPVCSLAARMLQNVLLTDCDFLYHLNVVEDLYLMRKGDLISDFCDALFSRIDARQVWTDYHFLNTTFRDVVAMNKADWTGTSWIRFSYKAPTYSRAIGSLAGLNVDYEAPFPLIYIFNRRTLGIYNDIFVLLLQIRRAKSALDNILVRNSTNNSLRSYEELKVFYGTRNKLSWFVNTLSTFFNQYVLEIGLRRFHHELESVESLDDILQLHGNHLMRLQRGCLLGDKEKTIHRAVMSILDNSLLFSDFFTAFAGDTTFDASRVSHSHSRRHRSRRLRRESRNVVSFSEAVRISEDSDSSDSDIDDSVVQAEPPAESMLMSFATPSFAGGEGDFVAQNDKMAKNLDLLIRYIRRGVEKVALSADRIEAFDTLAFALQDWDI